MQTKSFADLTAITLAQLDEARQGQAAPIELDSSLLQLVAGGVASSGGSSTAAAVTAAAPRGGWY